MSIRLRTRPVGRLAAALVVGLLAYVAWGAHTTNHTTAPFHGVKVNGGTVTHTRVGHDNVLTLSDDFKVPDAPAPHWQVVDSDGNTYLLQRLVIKEDKFHKEITIPSYVKDVARVQIWCSWAEALLGEAEFERPVR